MASRFAVYPSLRGRVAFVTGGASGIGESIVRNLAAQGAKVAFVDVDAAIGERLANALSENSCVGETRGEVRFEACDVRDIGALQAAIGRANAALGPIRILVNNAANDARHASSEVTQDFWDERMAVNLRPFFFAAQAVRKEMEQTGGGSIINLGSVSWILGKPDYPAYTAAKAAIHGLTRTLARDFASSGIRVNELCPGAVITEGQKRQGITEELLQAFLKGRQSLGDLIQPDDIARMALFLASDDAQMCTGQQFIVDGGWV